MNTTKEKAAKVQDLLTMCLAKAFNMALSVCKGSDWFERFKEEESNNKFPITRQTQNRIGDCDFQALLKILYYRPEYAKIILSFFNHSDYISDTKQKTYFQQTVGNLINRYRNDISAHVSANQLKGISSDEGSYSYSQAIRDMTFVAKAFECVTNEKKKSYYKLIKNASKNKSLIIIAAAVVVVLAVVILLWSPWKKTESDATPEQTTNIIENENITLNFDTAQAVVDGFFSVIKDDVSKGDLEAFKKHYDENVYTDEEINEQFQLFGDDLSNYKYEITPIAFTDSGICAMQFLYSDDEKESATFRWVIQNIDGEWKFSSADEELMTKYDEKMQDVFGDAYEDGYCNSMDYQVLFGKPIFSGVNTKLRTLYNADGSLMAEVTIFNGSGESIKKITLKDICLSLKESGENIVEIDSYAYEFGEEMGTDEYRYITINISEGESAGAATISDLLKNGATDLKTLDIAYSCGETAWE